MAAVPLAASCATAVGLQQRRINGNGVLCPERSSLPPSSARRAGDQAEISRVRPLCLPDAASRFIREWVERGSMPVSRQSPSPGCLGL